VRQQVEPDETLRIGGMSSSAAFRASGRALAPENSSVLRGPSVTQREDGARFDGAALCGPRLACSRFPHRC